MKTRHFLSLANEEGTNRDDFTASHYLYISRNQPLTIMIMAIILLLLELTIKTFV